MGTQVVLLVLLYQRYRYVIGSWLTSVETLAVSVMFLLCWGEVSQRVMLPGLVGTWFKRKRSM